MNEHPLVSIVIPNFNHPELITTCLRYLQTCKPGIAPNDTIQYGVPFEVVVVDNGSSIETVTALEGLKAKGWIDTLVPLPENKFFSEANNIGFAHSNPASEYILLLNSDVAVRRGDFLGKVLAWMNGVPPYKPDLWASSPARPSPGPRDIVSVGWSYDPNVPGCARPEGWCCMIRRKFWNDMSGDFPFHFGFEEAIAKSIRAGARAGVLSQYANYVVHREGGSGKSKAIVNKRQPQMKEWFEGAEGRIETLDFSIGELEHSSYLDWD